MVHCAQTLTCRCSALSSRSVGRLAWGSRQHRFRASSSTAAVAMAAAAVGAPVKPASPASIEERQQLIPGLLRWVALCNNGAEVAAAGRLVELTCDGSTVGMLRPEFAAHLQQHAAVFRPTAAGGLELAPGLATQQQRTDAVAGVLQQLREEGLVSGWRNELYPVVRSFHSEPAFLIERAAAPHFGIKAYGVHLNGYCVLPDGSKELWVARRSRSKPTWPGKLDHIVAGGQPHGLSCQENVVKECGEEASIPAALASQAVPVGAVSYTSLQDGLQGRGTWELECHAGLNVPQQEAGLKRDVLYCYDLLLPLDFVPQPQDGEVEEFMRLPLDQVARIMAETEDYKDNCNLVILDFLLRHGYLTPDMPGYLALLAGLRSGDCS